MTDENKNTKKSSADSEIYASDSMKKLLALPHEQRAKVKVVLTGGVFDLIHLGHLYTLYEARKYGNFIVVAVARDDMIEKKGRKPVHSQEYRAKIVEALKPVDAVVLGSENPDDIIKFVKPDVIVYGYDQHEFARPQSVKIVKLTQHLEPERLKTNKIIKELGL